MQKLDTQDQAVGNQKTEVTIDQVQSNSAVKNYNYNKIGEFTLKSNEDSNFTERELKSIDTDKE